MDIPREAWEYTFVFCLAFAVYINTLHFGFVYDDNRALLTNPDVQASTPTLQVFQNDFWGTPLSSSNSHGSYRPLCVLSFRLNHWLSGFHPLGFHLTNVLLHGLATVLVLKTSRALLPGRSSLLAATLFAVHPVHVEAVAGVVGRADVLASIFFMISFLLYVKHVDVRDSAVLSNVSYNVDSVYKNIKTIYKTRRTIYRLSTFNEMFGLKSKHFHRYIFFTHCEKRYFSLFVFFAVCAVLSKEPGITVIPLAVCYDVILHLRSKRKPDLKSYITASASASMLVFLIITLVRFYIMGLQTPSFSKADNPTAKESSFLTRTLTFFYLPVFNFLLLIWPQWQSFDWSMNAIPRVHSILDVRFYISLGFYYLTYCTVKTSYCNMTTKEKSFHKLQNCKLCTKDSGEEHLYTCKVVNNNNTPLHCNCKNTPKLPLSKWSGVTMCLAFMVLPFLPASNLFFYVGFVIAERVLYIPSIGFCMLVAVGAQALTSGPATKSLATGGIILLLTSFTARAVLRSQDWSSEEALYRSAVQINPPKAYANLGSILGTAGRLEEAEAALRLALDHRPNMADAHYNLGNLLKRQQKYGEAASSYKLAIQYRPSLAVAYLNLGEVLESLNQRPEAEEVYQKCTKLDVSGLKDPRTHEDARTSCGLRLHSLCEESKCRKESDILLRKLVKSRKCASKSRDFTPNELLATSSSLSNKTRVSEEEEMFLNVLQQNPSDPATYVNYGRLLVRLGRLSEAASMYVRAAELSPGQHALVTSAAVALRRADRLGEAERLYRRALDLRPLDASSHSNLGAIFHLQGKYREAASCYKDALRLAPGDEVTLTNLQKLRNLLSRNKR